MSPFYLAIGQCGGLYLSPFNVNGLLRTIETVNESGYQILTSLNIPPNKANAKKMCQRVCSDSRLFG